MSHVRCVMSYNQNPAGDRSQLHNGGFEKFPVETQRLIW